MLMNFTPYLYEHHLFYSRKTGNQQIKKVVAPRWGQETPYGCTLEHPTNSMLTAKFHILKNQDSVENIKEKKLYTDIILGVDNYSPSQQKGIIKYCGEDVTPLHAMANGIAKKIKSQLKIEDAKKYLDQALERARYQVSLTEMYQRGYSIDKDILDQVTNQEGKIVFAEKRRFNEKYPHLGIFELDRTTGRFVRKYAKLSNYIKENHHATWPRTTTGRYKLDEETVSSFALTKSKYGDIPASDFFGNLKKVINVEKTLKGFKRKAENTIYDSIGTDSRVRPYIPSFNGATGRTQYKSTNFLFLKSKWCRNLLQHPDLVHVAADYTSEEFLVSGLLSGDQEMVNAYNSGDVYVYFGSRYGIPRPQAKACVLGISYGLTKYGLSKQLGCSVEQAQEYIDQFFELFKVFKDWMDSIEVGQWRKDEYCQTKSGWTMFGKNPNFRSFFNFRIQASSADIMRDAVDKCRARGLAIIFTLHDAIYIESGKSDWRNNAKILSDCMKEAFIEYFGSTKQAKSIRIDLEAWNKDLPFCLAKDDVDSIFTKPSYVSELDDKGKPCKVHEEYKRLIGGLSPLADI